MRDMDGPPSLPPLYELIALEETDSAVAEARRRARDGAEEGTLVWVRKERRPLDRLGRKWFTAPGNLSCALILRPDYPTTAALQLTYVAAVSTFSALAALLSPGMGMRYRWPNDVLLNGRKVATVLLEAPDIEADALDWLIVALSVNIEAYPQRTPVPATSVHAEEGRPAFTDAELLEFFSRHFLSWINRWGEEGFAPVRKAWQSHAEGVGKKVQIELRNETVKGTLGELDPNGEMRVVLPDGTTRKLSPREFWGSAALRANS